MRIWVFRDDVEYLFSSTLHGLWANASSTSPSDASRVSGWKAMHTNVVNSAQLPKRKYGPDADLARKIGVQSAMAKLTT